MAIRAVGTERKSGGGGKSERTYADGTARFGVWRWKAIGSSPGLRRHLLLLVFHVVLIYILLRVRKHPSHHGDDEETAAHVLSSQSVSQSVSQSGPRCREESEGTSTGGFYDRDPGDFERSFPHPA